MTGGIDYLIFNRKDFAEARSILVREISSRPDSSDRVELWECYDFSGWYDPELKKEILRSRKNINRTRGKFVNKRALDELALKCSIPKHMAKLFLNELKLDNKPVNDKFRRLAKNLGLM